MGNRISATPEMWNVLWTRKGEHFYAFLFTDKGREKHLNRALCSFVKNPKLNFTAQDASAFNKKALEGCKGAV